MEKTGCEIICGAPTTLAVKNLMLMMMMMNAHKYLQLIGQIVHVTNLCLLNKTNNKSHNAGTIAQRERERQTGKWTDGQTYRQIERQRLYIDTKKAALTTFRIPASCMDVMPLRVR